MFLSQTLSAVDILPCFACIQCTCTFIQYVYVCGCPGDKQADCGKENGSASNGEKAEGKEEEKAEGKKEESSAESVKDGEGVGVKETGGEVKSDGEGKGEKDGEGGKDKGEEDGKDEVEKEPEAEGTDPDSQQVHVYTCMYCTSFFKVFIEGANSYMNMYIH